VSMLWNLVKIIYKSMPPKKQVVSHNLITQTSNQSSSGQSAITRGGSFGTAGLSILNGSNGPQANPVGSGENISSTDEILNDSNEIITVPKIPIPDLEVEIYDENMTQNAIDCKNLRNGFLYTGPHDSFVKDFPICSSSLLNHELMHQHYRNHRNEMEREMIETSPPPDAPSFLSVTMPDETVIQHWKPYQVLADCLILQSEVGDVQTPTCILLCLGKDREDLPIDKIMQENFLQSYIDMLHRHQMWNEATEIMKMSWMPIVAEMNQQSTIVHTSCGECGRSMSSWFCKHCKTADPSRCVVCNEIVKGAFTFCSFCCHGGHLHHMVEWFSQNPRCPKCNHVCEYD
jgi:WD repeat-containing protein 24